MSDANYRGRHRAPAGRHRAPEPRNGTTGTGRSGRNGFAGSGYLLPTAAAATLVLTATGAQLGSAQGASSAQSFASATPLSSATPFTSVTQDVIERELGNRAARSDSRTPASAAVSPSAAADTEVTAAGGTDVFPAEGGAQGNSAAQAQTDSAAQAADDKAAADAAAAQQAQTARAAKDQADATAAAQAQAATDRAAEAHNWVAPVNAGYTLSSGFGMRWGSMHPGQDFAIPVGSPVKAMSSGTVIFAGWSGGYGNKLEIQYWDGTVSWYAHNSKLLVSQGDKVGVGETVSLSGNTGHSTGPHLHLEVHPNNGAAVPPLPWLSKMGNMP